MDRLEDFAQAYSQAPWRKQLQIIGLFSLILVFGALVAGIYLNVSARAATAGRDIQSKQEEIEALDLEIEDLQCFSPAYPEPPYVVRESVEGAA